MVSSLLEAFGPPVFDQMQAADQTKLATLHCAELSACAQAEGDIAKSAEGTGIGLAYRAKVSLASGWTVGPAKHHDAVSGSDRSPSPTSKRKASPVSPELAQVLDRLADAERRAVRAELELERLRKEMDAESGNGDAVHALDATAERRGARRQPKGRTAEA